MEFQEFPKALYRGDECAIVENASEEAEQNKAGFWMAGIPPAAAAETEGETVESLRAKLDAAGIAFDKRWGLAKLQEAAKDIA